MQSWVMQDKGCHLQLRSSTRAPADLQLTRDTREHSVVQADADGKAK